MPISGLKRFLHRHWFTLAIPTVALCSRYDPSWMKNKGKLRMDQWKDGCVMTMFLMSGLSIGGLAALRSALSSGGFSRHASIQGFSLLAMPVVFAATFPFVASSLELPDAVVSGSIFMSCLPTTIGLGVVISRAAGGDTVLAILHATIGNSVGAMIAPITSTFFSGITPDVQPMELAQKLVKLIFVPGAIGLAARFSAPVLAAKYAPWYSPVQQLCLLGVLSNVFSNAFSSPQMGASFAQESSSSVEHHQPSPLSGPLVAKMLAVMAAYHLTLFGAAWLLFSRRPFYMPIEQRIAGCICATQKTAAMGVPMLSVMFSADPNLALLTLPLLTYHPMQILCGSLLAPRLLRLKR